MMGLVKRPLTWFLEGVAAVDATGGPARRQAENIGPGQAKAPKNGADRVQTDSQGWIAERMRSSKSRSRSKSNRNNNRATGANIINRVFDSSGPEGKVRGTPQQIIDKYNQLARDAQLANDRVATENFQQHAEHYLRLLAEAQREVDQRREEQERQNRERQSERGPQDRGQGNDPATQDQPDVLEVAEAEGDSGLVETPESRATEPDPVFVTEEAPAKKPRARRAPARKKAAPAPETGGPDGGAPEAAE